MQGSVSVGACCRVSSFESELPVAAAHAPAAAPAVAAAARASAGPSSATANLTKGCAIAPMHASIKNAQQVAWHYASKHLAAKLTGESAFVADRIAFRTGMRKEP